MVSPRTERSGSCCWTLAVPPPKLSMEPSPTTIACLLLAQMSRPCSPPFLPRQPGEHHRTRPGAGLLHLGRGRGSQPRTWARDRVNGRDASGPSPALVGRWGHWCQITLEFAPGSEFCSSLLDVLVTSPLPLLPKATSSMCLLQTPRAWSSMSTWTGQGSIGEHLASLGPSGYLGSSPPLHP